MLMFCENGQKGFFFFANSCEMKKEFSHKTDRPYFLSALVTRSGGGGMRECKKTENN